MCVMRACSVRTWCAFMVCVLCMVCGVYGVRCAVCVVWWSTCVRCKRTHGRMADTANTRLGLIGTPTLVSTLFGLRRRCQSSSASRLSAVSPTRRALTSSSCRIHARTRAPCMHARTHARTDGCMHASVRVHECFLVGILGACAHIYTRK